MVNNRSGDQLRKKSDEEAVVEKVILSSIAPPSIDQISDLLKSEERYCQRQNNLLQHNIATGDLIEIIDKEVGVFEIAKQP